MRFKNGEFQFGFQDLVKIEDFDGEQIEIKWRKIRKRIKKDLLEVSGYWAWDSTATEGFQGSFPRIGDDDI